MRTWWADFRRELTGPLAPDFRQQPDHPAGRVVGWREADTRRRLRHLRRVGLHWLTLATLRPVARLLVWLLADMRVVGLDTVPRSGATLITCNHIAERDSALLFALLPRGFAFLAKAEYFRTPLLGGLVAGAGAFPVRRGEADALALDWAVAVLSSGGQVCIYPEGRRSPTTRLQPPHRGVAVIARAADSCIVPVAITGTEQWEKARNGRIFPHPRITATFGEPYRMCDLDCDPDDLSAVADAIMARIAALLPAEYLP